MTTTATKSLVLLVTDVRLLEPRLSDTTIGHISWTFVKLQTEIYGIAPTGPQEVYLNFVLPDVSIREVDFLRLLHFINRMSDEHNLSAELVQYGQIVAGSPFPVRTRINSDKPAERLLTVNVMASEICQHDTSWGTSLSRVGINSKLSSRDENYTPYADVTTLLEAGFRHEGDPEFIGALVKGDHGQPWIRHFPADGTVRTA